MFKKLLIFIFTILAAEVSARETQKVIPKYHKAIAELNVLAKKKTPKEMMDFYYLFLYQTDYEMTQEVFREIAGEPLKSLFDIERKATKIGELYIIDVVLPFMAQDFNDEKPCKVTSEEIVKDRYNPLNDFYFLTIDCGFENEKPVKLKMTKKSGVWKIHDIYDEHLKDGFVVFLVKCMLEDPPTFD